MVNTQPIPSQIYVGAGEDVGFWCLQIRLVPPVAVLMFIVVVEVL